MGAKFDPARMDRLLAAERRTWNDPDRILAQLGLGPGMNVADVGCGPGFLTLELARRVGTGTVYAIDVSADMLGRLGDRVQAAGLDNVRSVLTEAEDEFPIHTDSCDAAVLLNVYHEVDAASNFLGELRRVVRPDGTVLVVDWQPGNFAFGPPADQRIDPADVVTEFTHVGFALEGTAEVGPQHYGLRFRNRRAEA